MRCPVGFGTSSRILRASPAVFVVSMIFAVTYTLLDIFGPIFLIFDIFRLILVIFDGFGTFSALISRFWLNGSGAQLA